MKTIIYQITLDHVATGYIYGNKDELQTKMSELKGLYPNMKIDYLKIEL